MNSALKTKVLLLAYCCGLAAAAAGVVFTSSESPETLGFFVFFLIWTIGLWFFVRRLFLPGREFFGIDSHDTRFQAFAENSPALIATLDSAGEIQEVSNTCDPLLPHRNGNWFAFHSESESLLSATRQALEGRQIRQRVAFPDHAFDIVLIPRKGAGGRVIGLRLVAFDVTESERNAREQKKNLDFLRRFNEITTSESDFAGKMEDILELGCRYFDFETALLTQHNGERLIIQHLYDPSSLLPQEDVDSRGSLCEEIFQKGVPGYYADVKKVRENSPFGCYLGIPIKAGSSLYGVLTFLAKEPFNARKEDDFEILKLIAEWIGNELDIDHNQRRMRTLLGQQETISQVAAELVGAEPEQAAEVIRNCLGRLSRVLQSDAAALFLIDEEVSQPAFHLIAGWEMESSQPPPWTKRFSMNEFDLVKSLIETGQWRFSDSIEALASEFPREARLANRAGVRSAVWFPFQSKGDSPTGMLVFVSRAGIIRWDKEFIPGLETAARTFQNICHRLKVYNELRRNKEQLTSILSEIQAAIWSGDPNEHRMIYMSPGAEILYGRPVENFYEDPELWAQVVHPDDEEAVSRFTDILHDQGFVRMEYRIIRPSGEVRWVADYATLLSDPNGKPIRLDGFVIDITERIEMEAELKLKKEQFDLFFEHAPAAVAMFDTEMRYILASQQWLTDYRLQMDDIRGRSHYEIFPEIPERWKAIHRECLKGAIRKSEHDEFHRLDGQVEYLRWEIHPWYKKANEIGGVILFTKLLGEDRRAELALIQTQRRMKAIVESAPMFILSIDQSGLVELAQGRGLNQLGFDPSALAKAKAQQAFSDYPEFLESLQEALEGNSFSNIIQFSRGNFEVWFRPNMQSDGQIAGAFAVGADITRRLKAEQQYRETEERFRRLANAASEGIAICGPKYILDVNQRLTELTGFSAEEIIGQPILDLAPPGEKERVAEFLLHGRETMLETQIMRMDGEFSAELRFQKIQYMGAEARVITIRDVTEQRLNEQRLREALEIAESAARAKTDFLANMSHEIRTPLNAVTGISELLLVTELNSRQRNYVEKIRGSSDTLMDLVNDILDFSKYEAGKMELESIYFDLRDHVEEIGDLLAYRAHAKDLDFHLSISPDLPRFVAGDPARLKQIIMNLAGNAVKFTSQGYVLISVEPEKRISEDKHLFRFEVADTGIGISEEKFHELFQPFQQADNTTTRKYGGTGLGLAISKGLVEMMGGKLQLNSIVGKGSSFSFSIPMGVSKQTEDSAMTDKIEQLHGCRVLLAEPSEIDRTLLVETFQRWNCSTVVVGNVDKLAEELEDPRGHDLALIEKSILSQLYQNREQYEEVMGVDLPIIMLARTTELDQVEEEIRSTYPRFLVKPIRQQRLLQLVEGALNDDPSDSQILDDSRRSIHQSPQTMRPLKILLVEDNETNQMVAQQMLKNIGYSCDIANDGEEALNRWQTEHWDLILMDCQMPRMDGYEAARRIREIENNDRRTPIVAMTAHALSGDREKCLQAGMDDYISKPVSIQTLRRVVEEIDPSATKRADETQKIEKQVREGNKMEDRAPVQLSRLNTVLGEGSPEILNLLEIFCQDAADRLIMLRNAIESAESDDVRSAAHTIKGASANVGAELLAKSAKELESLGASGDLHGAAELEKRLTLEFRRVEKFVAEMREKAHS